MEKKHALFIALAITGIIAGNWLFFQEFSEFDREHVIIQRVIDGDTVELQDGRTVRLLNINTEEKGRAWSSEASEYLSRYLNKSVEIEVSGVGKYGRILGRLYSGEEYLNLEIVRLGLAHVYLVEESEEKEFKKVEEKAREEEIGIWEKSEYDGCLDVEINKKDEYLVIEDICGLDFNGWSVKDESTKMYKFKDNKRINYKLFSEKGDDVGNELYWGQGKVWNDDRDSIFIRDSSGFLVYYDSYGY
jgi:endonuclease YncB( thermonuclease family)